MPLPWEEIDIKDSKVQIKIIKEINSVEQGAHRICTPGKEEGIKNGRTNLPEQVEACCISEGT
jgi:hypothetical protein